jgi:hypothetical protein
MGKVILASLLAGSLGGAALVTVGQTYYSTAFLWSFPINCGGFKTTPDLNNVWHWEGDATLAGTAVMVDFNGDGIMDTESPEVRVCITDMQLEGNGDIAIDDSSGTRWRLLQYTSYASAHMTTPIVLPVNSTLTVRQTNGGVSGPTRVRLIGRVVNI